MTSRYPTRSLKVPTSDETILVLMVIGLATAARLIFASGLDFGVDEAYAVAIGRKLQLSYFDHPPLTFWTVALVERLFGAHAPHLLLRLPFVLAFSGTLWLIHGITRRWFSARAGFWAVTFLSVAPFFFASTGSWIVPDGPLAFWLAATALLLTRILTEPQTPEETAEHWLFAGVTFGLACLSKYHAFLFGAGAVAFLLATPHRRLLASPMPWVAGVIALAIFSPVILWNAQNGWISLAFQSGRTGTAGGLHPDHLGQMLGGAAAYLLPWTLILLIWAIVRVLFQRPAWLDGADAGTGANFLLAISLPTILLFTLAPLFGNRGLPHWPMPGWLFVFPLLGALMAATDTDGARWPKILGLVSAILTGTAAIAMLVLLNSTTIASRILETPGLLDGKAILKPLVNEASDWKGLHQALNERGLLPGPRRFVVALKWNEAARIAAELGPDVPVVVANPDARGFAFLTDQTSLLGQDAILIGDWKPMLFIDDELKPQFEQIGKPQLLTLMVAGGLPKTLEVAVAHGFRQPYPLRYGITPAAK